MIRRSLGVALWTIVGLLACFLGALNALVSTKMGRTLLARVASSAVARAISGSIEVGEVRGSLLTGVVLTDVRLLDPDSTLVAWLPRAELGYNPIDFAAGRIVFMEVRLERPIINIVQHANGNVNFDELLRLHEKDTVKVKPLGPAGPRSLILLRNVQIQDGSLTLRLQKHGVSGPNEEIENSGEDGRYRVRRFEHLNARLAALRIQAPRENGIRIDILRLATEASDPKLSIADIVGRVTIDGHTLDVDLSRVRFPGTQFHARGTVQWPRDTLLWNLAMQADSATLADIRFIDPRFPDNAVLHGGVTLASHGGRVLEIRLQPLDLAFGQGRLTGHVMAFSAADSGLVALRQGDLMARDLSLNLARVYIDSLPFWGRLTGRTIVDGPMSGMKIQTEWSFRDSLVPMWPESQIFGKGEISVAGKVLAFQPFAVETGRIDIGTIRRLVPAFDLQGELDASGTLTGTIKNASFSGTLRHHDGDRPVSVIRGVMGLDNRTAVLGVNADVYADSLALDGLTGRIPNFPLRGTLTGPIRLSGDVAGLETHADLSMLGGGGGVRGDGILLLGARDAHPGYGARRFTLHAQDLNLQRWLVRRSANPPPTRLTFTANGTFEADSVTKPAGRVAVALAPSLFAGAIIDTGSAHLHFTDGKILVDSLRVQQPGLLTNAGGTLGWKHPDAGILTIDLAADSLSVLDSLVTWFAGPDLAAASTEAKLKGSAQVRLTLEGALDSMSLGATANVSDLQWRQWRLPKGEGSLSYLPGTVPRFDIQASLDSLGYGRFGFGAASAHARGTRDSLTWFARSRIGDLGAFLAGGRYARPKAAGTQHVQVDSLAVLLPSGVWFLQRPIALAFSDSTLHVDTAALQNSAGVGRITLGGDLPRHGPINARVALDSFPLSGIYALLEQDTTGVAGGVTAKVIATGTRAAPQYAGSFAFGNASFGSFRAPFMDGNVDYSNRRLNGELRLWRSGQQVLNVTAHLPLDLALVPVDDRQLPDTLSVQARADSVDLGVLTAVTTTVKDVSGVFSANLGIGGTWDAPLLRGGLNIGHAAVTIPALSVRYVNINGRLNLHGDTIRVDTVRAESDRGHAEVSGYVRLERLTKPTLALDIAASDFKALDLRDYLALTASGRVSLTGPVFGATLTGRGTVTSGVLHFADLINKRVVNLDEPWVQELIDTSLIRTQRLGPAFQSVFFDSLRINNLQLTMGDDAWLRSNEANIQLTGSVQVNKVRNQYVLGGTLEAPRGTYRLQVGPVTREFVVTQGTVRYFGTPDLNADLDISARHVVHPLPVSGGGDLKDIVVIAHIQGTLLVPKLTLESEQGDLSQAELISYLMFGKPTVDLSSGEAPFVRNVVASVFAGELERSVVSDLGVPLDYFEIRPGDPNNPFSGAQLAAGWAIGGKTFLVLNAGICSSTQSSQSARLTNALGASLQFRFSQEWRTEASFEPYRSCSIQSIAQGPVARQVGFDLFWERRY
ncbi:MAG TPA: translocation/assembly module TamB domain-containing protein [Gemmatimonadales bacterium]|nr:translocation/assembly module TamB domain-containing protein [Gemmatimonadales bacterium]